MAVNSQMFYDIITFIIACHVIHLNCLAISRLPGYQLVSEVVSRDILAGYASREH